jgi:hypothetical protein
VLDGATSGCHGSHQRPIIAGFNDMLDSSNPKASKTPPAQRLSRLSWLISPSYFHYGDPPGVTNRGSTSRHSASTPWQAAASRFARNVDDIEMQVR